MNGLAFTGLISLFLGILLLVIAWVISRRKTIFYQHAVRAEGNIIALIKRGSDVSGSGTNSDSETVTNPAQIRKGFIYAPIFEFHSSAGESHVVESKTFSYPPKYLIGDKVMLIYNLEHPEKAVIDSFMKKWLAVIILAIFGAIIFLFGLIIQYSI